MVICALACCAFMLQRSHACRETAGLHAQAQQWIDEVNEKAPQLRTALYHGPNRCRDFPPTRLACTDVVVTTYNVLHSEFNAAPQGSLYRVPWHRCVFCYEASALHRDILTAWVSGVCLSQGLTGLGLLDLRAVHGQLWYLCPCWSCMTLCRCILDEAHMIRNTNTQAARAAHGIVASRRQAHLQALVRAVVEHS